MLCGDSGLVERVVGDARSGSVGEVADVVVVIVAASGSLGVA